MAVERGYFFELADHATARLQNGEAALIRLHAETSDFSRFNASRLRQTGHVRQARLRLTLVSKRRQMSAAFDLSGQGNADRSRIRVSLDELRSQRSLVPEDRYLNIATEVNDSERVESANLPDAGEACAHIAEAFDGLDMTGIWACGESCSGFANSFGQRNWHAVSTFNFDWSVQQDAQSVKRSLAGRGFDPAQLANEASEARQALALLSRPSKRLKPGRYRAYFAPEALAEILSLLCWGGFGLQSHRSGRSPLMRLENGSVTLDPRVSIHEENAAGLAPIFTAEGFIKPDRVPLIDGGRFASCLVDARSAREFDETVNAAFEAPLSPHMASGSLADSEVLAALGDGLYISNVWYCNFSDRNACRVTGMTRFACLWVEGGKPQGPVEPMRFDDSLYGLLGDRLVDLSEGRRLLLDPDTYEARSFNSMCLPGVLVDGLKLTL